MQDMNIRSTHAAKEKIEEHDNIPEFLDYDVYISCEKCRKIYSLDISRGVRNWDFIKK